MRPLRLPIVAIAIAAALAFCMLGAASAESISALDAFSAVWETIDNYTCKIVTHETKGTAVQDRTYSYAYKKPHFARISIDSGPGRGSGAVWHGGDTVVGHQGGLLSGLHKTVPLTDPRATSLRGDTMDTASFQYLLDYFRANQAHEIQGAGPTVDGAATEKVELTVADPSKTAGITRDVLLISTKTHLPVVRQRFAGNDLVKEERFVDVVLNPGLKESDF